MRQRYHHFWASVGTAPVEPWALFLRDVKRLYKAFPDGVVLPNEKKGLSQDRNQTVLFTGEGRDGDEWAVFKLTSQPQAFVHCTTNWEPYDLLVTATLLAAKKWMPTWIKLTSDGEWNDWDPARSACRDVLGYGDADFEAAHTDFIELLDPEDRP